MIGSQFGLALASALRHDLRETAIGLLLATTNILIFWR